MLLSTLIFTGRPPLAIQASKACRRTQYLVSMLQASTRQDIFLRCSHYSQGGA